MVMDKPFTEADPDVIDLTGNISSGSSTSSSLASSPASAPLESADSSKFDLMQAKLMPPPPEEYQVDIEGYFTWEIKQWSKLPEDKALSPRFQVGDFEWNLLLFKKTQTSLNPAIYLEPHPLNANGTSSEKDSEWHVCAQFVIDAWNPHDPTVHRSSVSHHRFSSQETDWGFTNFLEKKNLFGTSKQTGFIYEDAINFTVYVRIMKDHTGVLWHNFMNYDSKKETGFVGLNNQGATCYLNSLLQSYFFTKLFRKKVFSIPTKEESITDYTKKHKTVELALQRLFYKLQTSDHPVDTLELTKSFGWDSSDAFTQHDVQELNRVLMDILENRMKGTAIEGCLTGIFVGKMKSFIRCINVDFESSRVEDYWDIQLNVKGMGNLEQSFANYIEPEVLDGDNKYEATGYGLQDANKGVVFESFPPVLHLQLKRFEYDFQTLNLMKINDRHEFPDSIDLKPYLDKSSSTVDEDWEYELHGVLVHTGDISTGHYYALIKPSLEDEWYRFDDDRVWKCVKSEVFEQNFGANRRLDSEIRTMTKSEYVDYQQRRHTSAYMLVYLRKSKLNEIMDEVTDEDVPKHVRTQIDLELEAYARRKREMEEMHLYVNFRVYTNDTFMKFQGSDLGPLHSTAYGEDPHDPESNPIAFRFLKEEKFSKVLDTISEALGGKSVEQFRLWFMSHRDNRTIRPCVPVSIDYEEARNSSVETVFAEYDKNPRAYTMRLFVEEPDKELRRVAESAYKLRSEGKLTLDEKEHVDSLNLISHFNQLVEATRAPSPTPFVDVSPESNNLIVFLKFFDVANQRLVGFTHAIISADQQVSKLTRLINFLFNQELEAPIKYYEEVEPSTIETMSLFNSFDKSEIGNGDIICFNSLQLPDGVLERAEYKSPIAFYDFFRTRVHLFFKPLKKALEDEENYVAETPAGLEEDTTDGNSGDEKTGKETDLWVSHKTVFPVLLEKLGKALGVDPNYIRLFYINEEDKRVPLFRSSQYLLANLPPYRRFTFEYEILSITLEELETMKLVKLSWIGSGINHEQKHEFLVPDDSTVQTVVDRLQPRVGFNEIIKQDLMIWASYNHTFQKPISLDFPVIELASHEELVIGLFPEYTSLWQEFNWGKIGDSDGNLTLDNTKFIPVVQYQDDPHRATHGSPFIFLLIQGEKIEATKTRIQKIMGLGAKEFSKVGISLLGRNFKPVNIPTDNPDIILFNEARSDTSLGLNHPDPTAKRHERAIFIKN
ncbi:unnamed protein product [Kuraishia capsulata CBS 1993]|uniref:ubiquitinyl hydrolase 1 n=1 Tax=Kuraishia capsulata CBS 1993 TaxID=1382522 RepID=W6MPG8_9ASCO|nr:uncharacterized protein KUCA_T00004578001 [Kuraishia capsulata CBS 1993]CDK28594.1 unnamed protein product [Kuraishia capsulata CBS 1993]